MLNRLAGSSHILATAHGVAQPARAILPPVTLVLLTPIALDAGAWEHVPLPGLPTVKHVFPGFGGRERAPTRPTMASLADEIAQSYDGPFDVAGCSLGAMVAMHLAIRHPDRVRSLFAACTGPSADPAVMEQRASDAEALGMDGVLQVTLERWFTPAALAQRPEHPGVVYARGRLLALDPHAFADGWRAIGGHDARAELSHVTATTTVVAGTADAAATVERVRGISDRVPGARLVILDGPHMMLLEEPVAFGKALADHLERVAV
jgi:3-oxoadipate enol-lactonase